jgi:creatinine amidohydrolase/Fe(II)-dependent formamide hydrolase-like protein
MRGCLFVRRRLVDPEAQAISCQGWVLLSTIWAFVTLSSLLLLLAGSSPLSAQGQERTDSPGAYLADLTGPGYRPGLFPRDPADSAYSPRGNSGDPTLATAEKSRRLLDVMTGEWLGSLRAFSQAPLRPGG